MKVIHADQERRYDIPGVPGPARKPVDIDADKTGFTRLRSLRVYRFDAGSVIDGHAEEDEVLVVVTTGSAEIKIGWENSSVDALGVFELTAAGIQAKASSVVYLPPHSVYQLTPHTPIDVAYARAMPSIARPPAVFAAKAAAAEVNGITMLLQEQTHAQHLRLRIARIDASQGEIQYSPLLAPDNDCEALVHVQGSPMESLCSISTDNQAPDPLQSWDTVVLHPGEQAELHVPQGAILSLFTVFAV